MLPSSGTAGGAGQPPRIPSSRWMDDRRKGFPSSAPPFSCGTERPAAPSAWRQRCPSSLRSAGLPELDPAPAARGVTQQQTPHDNLKQKSLNSRKRKNRKGYWFLQCVLDQSLRPSSESLKTPTSYVLSSCPVRSLLSLCKISFLTHTIKTIKKRSTIVLLSGM